MTPELLDWRHAQVGDPAPCVLCRSPALMRDPDTNQPKHKVCAEQALAARKRAENEAA
ncbi:hypothetical protein [Streptomyces glomeratus]|uniref:4Fe-4S Wbl-type domain-containing protein n=1 Tax=Streptomyces glomeratus TaxID=284452 RepID=A0ABP6LDV7_9ACTN|nr:hypothetical protein [Streptomyces glomeratus]MCF1507052.1 hypothetical protein [Streptomyces glomeratus]